MGMRRERELAARVARARVASEDAYRSRDWAAFLRLAGEHQALARDLASMRRARRRAQRGKRAPVQGVLL